MSKKKGLVFAIVCVAVVFGLIVFRSWPDMTTGANSVEVAQPLSHDQSEAFKDELTGLLKDKDPKASFDYLRSAMTRDAALARECHPLLHHLGHAAYEKYNDFTKAISFQDGLCNSGYTHGVIEAHFLAADDIQQALRSTCLNIKETKYREWQCYHGVGHGVMYFTGKDLARSLGLCERLSSTFASESCINGVFMERFIVVSHSTGLPAHGAQSIKTDLCRRQETRHKSHCYFYAPLAYLTLHVNDYAGAFDDCRLAERSYVAVCMQGVGGQAAKENVTKPEVAREICKQALQTSRRFANACIEGAVELFINHHSGTTPVTPLCTSIFADFKEACEKAIEYKKRVFSL